MLDLDSLAEECARARNEKPDQWRTFLWSKAFQELSANMSDGEVETLLAQSPSLVKLENLLQHLRDHPARDKSPPFTLAFQEAKKAGLSLGEWMASLSAKESV